VVSCRQKSSHGLDRRDSGILVELTWVQETGQNRGICVSGLDVLMAK